MSNAKFLVHALRPKVAIMNNGGRKGGDPETLDIIRSSPGLQDLWQLHYAPYLAAASGNFLTSSAVSSLTLRSA